jgi:hypothetical protein
MPSFPTIATNRGTHAHRTNVHATSHTQKYTSFNTHIPCNYICTHTSQILKTHMSYIQFSSTYPNLSHNWLSTQTQNTYHRSNIVIESWSTCWTHHIPHIAHRQVNISAYKQCAFQPPELPVSHTSLRMPWVLSWKKKNSKYPSNTLTKWGPKCWPIFQMNITKAWAGV